MQQTLTVTQINAYIQDKMDNDALLSSIAVKGEISNYKLYPSGHHYFTLKDENSALKCVMFKGNAFRLRFKPDNGMKVIALGKISVFPRDGAYQLYCTAMAIDGIGDLHAAFEQLKAKLQKEGLFEKAHKKPIPQYPRTIGIITSSAGAAIHDMLRILAKRYPLAKVRLFPVRVQGIEAPGEISDAIRYVNQHKLADLLIVGRGGGSIEDLWAFNDETLARVIYNSEIPIISAVGHEPDVTIADYVADLRAATPSNGAELAVTDKQALFQLLDGLQDRMDIAASRQIRMARMRLKTLASSGAMQGPAVYVRQKRKSLELLCSRLTAAQGKGLSARKQRFMTYAAKLDAMSPLKVLTRGYSLTTAQDGSVLHSVKNAQIGQQIDVRLSDGSITACITGVKENENESE